MKKIAILLIASLITTFSYSQCSPDTRFKLAVIPEVSTNGFQFSAGIVGQGTPLSLYAGVKTGREIQVNKDGSEQEGDIMLYPLLEPQYRLFGSDEVSVHAYGQISKSMGAGVITSLTIGYFSAIRFRFGYDKGFVMGMGLIALFN